MFRHIILSNVNFFSFFYLYIWLINNRTPPQWWLLQKAHMQNHSLSSITIVGDRFYSRYKSIQWFPTSRSFFVFVSAHRKDVLFDVFVSVLHFNSSFRISVLHLWEYPYILKLRKRRRWYIASHWSNERGREPMGCVYHFCETVKFQYGNDIAFMYLIVVAAQFSLN